MLKTACGNGFPLNIPSIIPESGGSGGTSDYSDLTNKPKINNVTLSGDKSAADLGLASADIEDLIPADASSSNQLATEADLPGLATTRAAGLVKPDGTTVTVDANGVLTAVGGSAEYFQYTVTVNPEDYEAWGVLYNVNKVLTLLKSRANKKVFVTILCDANDYYGMLSVSERASNTELLLHFVRPTIPSQSATYTINVMYI